MKNRTLTALTIIALSLLQACGGKKGPDVSGINVDFEIQRFDKAQFELDTTNLRAEFDALQKQFPHFTNEFTSFILGIGPVSEEVSPEAEELFRFFVRSYKPVYDSLKDQYKDMSTLKKELQDAFRHVKYYFPSYEVPEVVSYIGPLDAPGIALTQHALAIGLQLFGGKDFFFYNTTEGQTLYPSYISRRFEKAYIPVNAMRSVIDDMFPPPAAGALIDQMIAGGKQWYLLDLFLPNTADSLKTGFTAAQLEFCTENEGNIWNFIMKATDLYTIDQPMIRMFIGDAPYTEGMPETSPGNIGQWIGFRIVQKYMSKFPDTSIEDLMKLDNRKLFQDAGYKPK